MLNEELSNESCMRSCDFRRCNYLIWLVGNIPFIFFLDANLMWDTKKYAVKILYSHTSNSYLANDVGQNDGLWKEYVTRAQFN